MFGGRDEWERHAACQGVDASLFFAPNRFEPKREREAREAAAKAICDVCPVIDPCREASLVRGEIFGVWGGLGELDRRELLSRLTASRAG
ncbi:MAG: WhiB family transcriptional regulator [Nitriliruptorales bacterium]